MAPSKRERTEAARDALESSRRAAIRLSEQAGGKETEALLLRARADLQARLNMLSIRGLDDTFTAVQLRATLQQVELTLVPLVRGMQGILVNGATQTARQAAGHTIDYLAEAERAFRGVAQPLALDEARMLNAAAMGSRASVLRRLLEVPAAHHPRTLRPRHHPARPGILQRYGHEVVGHFERTLQVGLVAKKSWRQMREDLTEDSPFLEGAPKHWAHRIVRSEVMGSYARGAVESIKEAGKQLDGMVKILSAVFDERTAADSYAVHGQIRRPEEDFESWYGPYAAPPNRPNDREVVTPHRLSWPIPPYLRQRTDEQVLARWQFEGRKGAPPERPLMTTVPLSQFAA